MQTFLPHRDYSRSAACLDDKRLNKQRVECAQIVNVLAGHSDGYLNHPAVQMWKHRCIPLVQYSIAICLEWRKRGFKDSLLSDFQEILEQKDLGWREPQFIGDPKWLGNAEFHASHRAALMVKNWNHYRQFEWAKTAPAFYVYVWPEDKP